MTSKLVNVDNQHIKSALSDLQRLIRKQYPEAQFEVFAADDPEGVYLRAIIDVEDTDTVVDTFIERLLEVQIQQGLPVYVIPVRPLKHIDLSRHLVMPTREIILESLI